MSRSRRKSPYVGLGADSEKFDKQRWHGALRSKERVVLKQCLGDWVALDAYIPFVPNDIITPWEMAKDGKCEVEPNSKYMRK